MELKHNIETLSESLEGKNKQINSMKKSHGSKTAELEAERN